MSSRVFMLARSSRLGDGTLGFSVWCFLGWFKLDEAGVGGVEELILG